MKPKLKILWWLLIVAFFSFLLWSGYAGHPQQVSSGWSAYSIGDKPVPVTQAPGDVVTLPIPSPRDRIQCVAFLVEPLVTNLTGKTITAQITIAQTGTCTYRGCLSSGCPVPPNMRLYFTTTTGAYSLRNANGNQTQYFWADVAWIAMGDGTFTLSAPLDGSQWSDSQGVSGSNEPAAFAAAVANVHQIGFSFGSGCYFDVGLGLADNNGTATLHVQSLTVQ